MDVAVRSRLLLLEGNLAMLLLFSISCRQVFRSRRSEIDASKMRRSRAVVVMVMARCIRAVKHVLT